MSFKTISVTTGPRKFNGYLLSDNGTQNLYFLPEELNYGFDTDSIGFAKKDGSSYIGDNTFVNVTRSFVLTLSERIKSSLDSIELEKLEQDAKVQRYKELKGIK